MRSKSSNTPPGATPRELVARFEKAAATRDAFLDAGQVARANRAFDQASEAYRDIKRGGAEACLEFLTVLQSSAPGVRRWAATLALEFAPVHAERVLTALAARGDFAAGRTLEAWHDGDLRFPSIHGGYGPAELPPIADDLYPSPDGTREQPPITLQPALPGDAVVERVTEANGFVANGGVMHAIEVLESDSAVADAVAAFRFCGLDLAAEALEFAASRFMEWETDDEAGDDIEDEADRLYDRQQLTDEALRVTADRLRAAHPELFATD